MSTQEFYVILTVQRPLGGGGFATRTVADTVNVQPGGTRGGLLTWARRQLPGEWRDGSYNVLFFYAEPNEMVPATPAQEQGSVA